MCLVKEFFRKYVVFLFCLVCGTTLHAQEKMYIHKSDHITLGALISDVDSVYFNNDGSIGNFRIGETLAQYWLCFIDSISFGEDSKTIVVDYKGNTVSVINPLAFEGVTVEVTGADVTVTSITGIQDINYQLSGTASDGMFKIYSEKRFNLLFNGVSISNANGPAINIQANRKATVILADGTANILADGSVYADPVFNSDGQEDQDAAFFSEGKLVFNGNGSLTITGSGTEKHALCSDDIIEINGGNIIITGSARDGIHARDGIVMTGGTINVTSTGDAIDGDEGYILISGGQITTNNSAADADGITCDSILDVSGGTIDITVSGNQSKGIRSAQNMILRGGSINITTSGAAVLEASGSGYDPAYCTGIKCNGTVTLSGADIVIKSTGAGGKGISSDTDIVITAGSIKVTTSGNGSTYTNTNGAKDSYHASCITADGNISVLGGSVTTSSSGSGGKGITCNGSLTIGNDVNSPVLDITTTGTKITISGSNTNPGGPGGAAPPGQQTGVYDEAKAIKSDGAIAINNGTITISSADDGIKSETSITISKATVSIIKSYEAIEGPVITVNNGNVNIVASNDGFNATKGNGGEANDGSYLYLYGGNIFVNVSDGDGLDSNGNIVMTSGTVVVHGPQSQPEVGMDFNGTFNISGGLLVVSGTNSNMTEAPNATSSQYSVKAMSSASIAASTIFHVQDDSGNDVVTFKPVRSYYSMIFSSSLLRAGSTYHIYTGGTSTGTEWNGLYTGGTYSGGTLKKSFVISGKVTSVSF
jgi:hypothetical protein